MPASRIATKLALGSICLALCSAAQASSIVILDGNFSSPDYAFYTYTDIYGAVQTNIPISPYIATLNGDGYNNASVLLVCYDFYSPTDVGTPYTGSVEPLSGLSSQASSEVLEATYLINELNADGLLNASLATRGAISTAIWEITNPSSTTAAAQFASDPAAQPYIQQAADAVSQGWWTVADANTYPTWVPANPAVQRFGIILLGQPPILAPEPPTWTLMSLGLLGLCLFAGRSRALSLKSALSSSRPS